MTSPIVIRVTRQQLETGMWRDVLPVLVALMSPAEDPHESWREGGTGDLKAHAAAISARRGEVHWEVEGKAGEAQVRALFHSLDAIWPLWAHFTARDDSLLYVATALYGDPLTPSSVLSFIDRSIEVLRDFYLVYDVEGDMEALRAELSEYFTARLPPVPA